ncbi:MAG: cysteine desulfurase family protein [Phycisphaerales bacterium]
MPVYLDNNATTQPLPRVVEAMDDALRQTWANPSSVHRAGQAARHAVELSRASVARLIGVAPAEVVFTSGATESINLAIRGVLAAASAGQGKRSVPSKPVVVSTPIEHEAVRELLAELSRRGVVEVRTAPVGRDGAVSASEVAALIDDAVALVNVMWANNETGVMQPVEEIGAICRDRGVIFHVDGTQVIGKRAIDVARGGPRGAPVCDLLSFSAHKFHGPKGAGALWVRRGVRLVPQQPGVQERERRAGTENVPAIVGMGEAADAAADWLKTHENTAQIIALRDRLEGGVLERVPGAKVNGAGAARLDNTTNIAFPKLEAEALLLLLSERGVYASAGAACSSGSLDPSPVLLAMGIPSEEAHGSLRFSLSRLTTDAEIDEALGVIPSCVERLRASATSVR